MNYIGERIPRLQRIKEKIVRLTNECEGPFVLIGSYGRRTVSAAMCGSDEMSEPGLNDPQEELAIVQRYEEENED